MPIRGITFALLVVLTPWCLETAALALARSFALVEHTCACGMTPGKCGCPACARLKHAGGAQRRHALGPVVGTCGGEGAVALHAPVSPAIPVDEAAIVQRSPSFGMLPPVLRAAPRSWDGIPPPTPPPRREPA